LKDKMTELSGKNWDLSLYELHRTPQEAITDKTEISISPKDLQSELTCPICLEMLTSTMTTKECLHRFCAECITTALRSGNKECPTCRKKLVSRRSLRPDPNFDALLSKIFPDREEYEEQQEKALAILSRNHSAQLMSSIGDAIKAQAAHVRMMNKKKNISDYDELMASHCQVGDNPDTDMGMEVDNEAQTLPYRPRKKREQGLTLQPGEIELIFKPHTDVAESLVNQLGDKQFRYVKTVVSASVDHLIKFLCQRLEADLTETKGAEEDGDKKADDDDKEDMPVVIGDLKLFVICQTSTQYVELTGPETLDMVVEDFWKVPKPLELHYLFDLLE